MDSANEFFGNLIGGATTGMNTAMVGRIERFDAKKMKADVLPMVRDSQGKELSLLIEVPVALLKAGGFVIRPPYKKGDLVLVVFADSDIDNFMLSGRLSTRNSTRTHSLNDAIIIGSIMPFTQSLELGNPNDLVIGNEKNTTKLVLKESGDVVIEGGNVYLGSEDASEGIPLGNQLKSWLDNHTHDFSWSDSGGNGKTKPPSPSPEPSKVVKTK